jgi:hypothetical protein
VYARHIPKPNAFRVLCEVILTDSGECPIGGFMDQPLSLIEVLLTFPLEVLVPGLAQEPADVERLQTLRDACRRFDALARDVRRLVARLADQIGCSQEQAIERLSAFARVAHDTVKLEATFATLLDDRRDVLQDVTGLERDAVRVLLSRARKQLNAA